MGLGIRRGDKVTVLAGRDKGRSGRVIHVYPKEARALVEGVNMVKKHTRKSQQHPQGAILNREIPIPLSKLGLLCPVSGKPTRLKTLVAADGSKQRISAKNKAVMA